MAAGLSWFPMVQYFYEQLEAIMEMRVLNIVEQSSPSDDSPLSPSPLPSHRKLNTNGLCAFTHTFSLHAVICTCILRQNRHSTKLPWTQSVHMYCTAAACFTRLKQRYAMYDTNKFPGFQTQIAETFAVFYIKLELFLLSLFFFPQLSHTVSVVEVPRHRIAWSDIASLHWLCMWSCGIHHVHRFRSAHTFNVEIIMRCHICLFVFN